MRVYEGSNGHRYTDEEVWRRFETEVWRACMWDTEAGWELVETQDEDLLLLTPTDEAEVPESAEP